MTKKQTEDLQELKRKAHKTVSLSKKIDESSKLGMTHRNEEYIKELGVCIDKMNELYKSIKH